jgi:hypothetical protein
MQNILSQRHNKKFHHNINILHNIDNNFINNDILHNEHTNTNIPLRHNILRDNIDREKFHEPVQLHSLGPAVPADDSSEQVFAGDFR